MRGRTGEGFGREEMNRGWGPKGSRREVNVFLVFEDAPEFDPSQLSASRSYDLLPSNVRSPLSCARRLQACLPSPRPEQAAAAPPNPDQTGSPNSTTPFAAAAGAAVATALLTAICLSATGILCRTEQSLWGQSSPGLVSEIR